MSEYADWSEEQATACPCGFSLRIGEAKIGEADLADAQQFAE
jgi:hypothetical protein